MLKQLVYQVYPDIDSVTGSDDKVREVLWKALKEALALIDEEMLRSFMRAWKGELKLAFNRKDGLRNIKNIFLSPNSLLECM